MFQALHYKISSLVTELQSEDLVPPILLIYAIPVVLSICTCKCTFLTSLQKIVHPIKQL